MATPAVKFEKHEPERRRKAVTTLHCGCTCCCCCCLHTLGSIVCAAVAPAIGSGGPMPLTYYWDDVAQEEIPLASVKKPGFSAVTIFWWVSCFFIVLSFAVAILMDSGRMESLLITGVLVLMFFPIGQLVAAIVTMLVFACWPRYDKFYQLKQLGKITLGVIAGTIAGILLMVGIGFAIAAFNK